MTVLGVCTIKPLTLSFFCKTLINYGSLIHIASSSSKLTNGPKKQECLWLATFPTLCSLLGPIDVRKKSFCHWQAYSA